MLSDRELLISLMQNSGSKKGRGDMYTCPSPHHDDKNPSTHIYSHMGKYRMKCHSCGLSENYVGLKGHIENKTYSEVVRELLNIEIKSYELDDLRRWPCVRLHEYTINGKVEFLKIKCLPKPGKPPWLSYIEEKGRFYRPIDIGKNVPLYNRQNIEKADFVIYAEGEKDCNTLIELGFTAVTAGGGASGHRQSSFRELKGKTVFVWMDNDHAGQKAVDSIVSRLIAEQCLVYVVDSSLMDFKDGEGNDVTDYVDKCKREGWNLKYSIENILEEAKPQKTARQKYRDEVNSGLLNTYATGIDLLDEIGFIKPRNISTIVGRGGIGKTWLVNGVQKVLRDSGVKASALYLEDNIDLTRDRLIAQASRERNFTDHDWCSAFPR